MNVTTIRIKNEMEALTPTFKSHTALAELLADRKQVQRVASAFELWTTLETTHRTSQVAFGEIAHRLLKRPIAEQQEIMTAIAGAMGVTAPSYEGALTGRIQFAHVVYGKQAELCERRKGEKDSRAGKRVSEAIRLYLIESGQKRLGSGRKNVKRRNRVPKTALRKSYKFLYNVAESEKEREVLVKLFTRLGIEVEQVEKKAA